MVVNSLIGDHVAERLGLTVFSPDTGPQSAVRDAAGRIVGVRRRAKQEACQRRRDAVASTLANALTSHWCGTIGRVARSGAISRTEGVLPAKLEGDL